MKQVRWAVVYFWFDGWDLQCEVWKDSFENLQRAEYYRSKCLETSEAPVQNVQCIQYDE